MTKPVRINYTNPNFAGFSTKSHLKKKISDSPVPWFPGSQSDCDFDFQTGFFIFFISLGTCPRLCSSTRNVDCAAPFPLLCRGGPILNSGLKILIPTKTTRKAATMRFVVSPCVLDCFKGSYAGVFRGFSLNHVILSLRSKLHLNFTNVPLAVH